MTPGFVVLTLSLLLGIQPITTDLYLPALPAITSGFGAPLSQAQLTLTGMLLAFGCSQMVWGPLSDRLGRRPILLTGLTLYTVAAVGSVFANDMHDLVVWRLVQGAAMGAAVMAGRAIVRDLYQPEQGARVLSKALSGLGVLAAFSAPVGSWVASHMGWRAALAVPALFGAVALGLLLWRFQETLKHPNPNALQPAVLVRTWRTILSHPTFWAYSVLATVSYAGLFTFLGASSFVFIDVLGVSRVNYGWVMFTMATSYLLGTFVCRRLLVRVGVKRTVAMAGFITLTGGTLAGVLPWLGVVHPLAILGPFCLFTLAHGVHQPCGQAGATGPFPQAAGAASALAGLMSMLAAFGVGTWLGWRMDGTVFPLTQGLWFWSACIAATAWTLVQRFGDTPKPPQRTA
jgi:DHA1 family bicyclomycin/chloramphenicol resistance-like MFS transporter